MQGPAFLPIRIRPTRKCDRCGLHYPKSKAGCNHCSGLSEAQVEELQRRWRAKRESSARLGGWFLLAAAGILIVMLIATVQE